MKNMGRKLVAAVCGAAFLAANMMPVMAVSISLIAPLGLALYWLISNLLMILERLFVNKLFKDEEEEVVN